MPDPRPVSTAPDQRQARPVILDLSRSFSRAARAAPTGIDRVERAYWSEIACRAAPAWAIVRHGKDYALLECDAAEALMRRLAGRRPGARYLSTLVPRLAARLRSRALARLLRRRSTYFGSLAGLMVLLSARFGQGFEYINVGHCNLDDFFLHQIRTAGASPLRIKLHDMIPLDFPDLVRADTPALFRARVRAAMTYADQIICNSEHTARRVAYHATHLATRPNCVVAHLGVSVPPVPRRARTDKPYFVCVGTIEPRKNHDFLFEVWQRLADRGGPVPHLYLAGARGWDNDAVFRLLDGSALMGRHITECSDLPDAELFALLAGAAALVFPSHEEGFGLPALEARALGVPVICAPIPVFKEVLAGDATMLPTDDPLRWADAVQAHAAAVAAGPLPRADAGRAARVPGWDQHFEKVFGPRSAATGRADQAAQGALTSVKTV